MILLIAAAAMGGFQHANLSKPETDLRAWVSRNVAPSSKIRININTRNLPVVHVTTFHVDGLKWLSRQPRHSDERPTPVGKAIRHFDLTIASKGQVISPTDNYFSRQVNLPPMNPGVYLLTFSAKDKSAWAVVDVTQLCTVVHRSPTQTLVWVTNDKSGTVVPNAKIKLFDEQGLLHASSVTRVDGTALFSTSSGQGALVVETKTDVAGVETSGSDPNGVLRCLFQTDRPIYRPGQTLQYKAVLRLTNGQEYVPLRNTPVTIQLRDPRDNPLDEVRLQSNAIGSVAGSFKVPQEGMLGAYTLVLSYGTRDQAAYQTFTVAEYRKPEYKVDVKSLLPRYLSGQKLHFSIDAAYYFGAPVPQAQVQWIIRRNNSPYRWDSKEDTWFYSGDGNMYARDIYAASPFAADGAGVTDNHGHLDVEIESDPNAPDSTYSLSVTVTDSSRRQVTGVANVPVYSAELRLGLSCLKQTVAIGDLVPVKVQVLDLDGHPRAASVRIAVISQVWDKKKGILTPKVLARKVAPIPFNGTSTVNLPALAYGDLQIVAECTDRTGRKAHATESVWVASMDYRPEKESNDPSLDLHCDKRIYSPGDTVHAYAFTNRPKMPVLFVMTGGKIWNYKVVSTKKAMAIWNPHTSTKQSPNAFISAELWADGSLLPRTVPIPLPDKSRLLNVKVTPDKAEYRPGDRATYRVRTLDQQGHGVASEVAVAVVDDAIYALSQDITPDPYQFYWGRRPDQVQTFQSAPEELSGGAFQNVSSVAPVRQRFEDTAFWQAFVTTDADGNGQVSFEMPGNLTSWRATARAVTGETRVGSVQSNVTATRPVTLRLATPRLVAQGDTVSVIATVDNRTPNKLTFELNLRCEGVNVDGPSKLEIAVEGKSEGIARWTLNVKDVPLSGHMTLNARAGSIGTTDPDLGDALSVSVPVVPRGVAETTLVGGTITDSHSAILNLPADTLPQGSMITVKITGGVQALMHEDALQLLANGRYGTMWAVDALKAAVAIGATAKSDEVKEAFALLSRDQLSDGWGWWEGAPGDPKITAEVGYALALAEKQGYTVFASTKSTANGACLGQYQRTNLWEDRARLSASMEFLDAPGAGQYVDEVIDRGLHLSPFSTLRLAESLVASDPTKAKALLDRELPLVSEGPKTAYIPLGFGIGWSASEVETAAELLIVLNLLDEKPELQTKLATRLTVPDEQSYICAEDSAAIVRAMSLYGKDHLDAKFIGDARVVINGNEFALTQSTIDESASAEIRDNILHGGLNAITLSRKGPGEALFSIQAKTYRPSLTESIRGVRVVRRFETRNDAGVWSEVTGPVKPGEPVRTTVVVWGDDISDALKVVEPIPAGFEYVDSDFTAYSREEVRDGALVHYLLNSGTPTYFRYYIRAEADGKLMALPVTAEYLRRPETRGHSSATEIVIHP